MKALRYTLLCILMATLSQAQTLTGTVRSSDGKPVEGANASLKGTSKGSVTDENGLFTITNLKAGGYTLVITRIGSARQERHVEVTEGATTTVEVTLPESATQLDEVVIDDNRINRYYLDSSFSVAKLPLRDIENPQVYNSISKKLLSEQVVTNINDALKNATGITRLWESTGRGGDGAEYYTLRGFAVQPTMVNAMPSINNGGLDPANVETIEVIKGPSGTLFGSSFISYGGLINVATKRPYDRFGGEVGFVAGSNGLNRFTADINTPLSDKALVRVNAAYHTQNSFQDAGSVKSFFVAPSLTLKPSDRLTFLLNAEFLSKESVNGPMIFLNRYAPLTFDKIDVFESVYKNSFTGNELSIRNPTLGLQAQALYKLSGSWTSQTVLSTSSAETNGYYHYLWDMSDGDSFARYISKRTGETNTTDIQQNFIADFSIGKLRNRMIVGIDYFNSAILNSSTGWVANGVVTLSNAEDTGILTQAGVDELVSNTFEGNSTAKSEAFSLYVSDVISLSQRLSVMASLRVDRFSGKTAYWATDEVKSQTSVSPKLGVVFQPLANKLSLFANYMNGFINVAPTEVSEIDGSNPRMKTFDPEHANQAEIGFKSSLHDGRVSITGSYYSILVKNRVMTDPDNVNNSIQGGEVKSQGFELSVVANPLNGLNLIAGYSDNASEVTKDNPGDGYLGMRPEESGPEHLANFWVGYTFQSKSLRGLGIGFGGNYGSEHKTLNRENTGTFTLPSYTILNAALSYTAPQYSIIFKINNLTDRMYFSGWSTVTPQNLRNLSLGFTYRLQ